MKTEELNRLSQELDNDAAKLLKDKEEKQKEVENYIKEVERMLISIIEDEKNNLAANTIFSWNNRKRLKNNGNTRLGNYRASNEKNLLNTSTYKITENGIILNIIYDQESALVFDKKAEEKIKSELSQKNIEIRNVHLHPNRTMTEIYFLNDEIDNKEEKEIRAAFREYRRKRKLVENKIKANPNIITPAAIRVSEDICRFLQSIIAQETSNLNQSSIQEIIKEGQIIREIDLEETTLTPPETIAPSFFNIYSKPKYTMSGDSIEISYTMPSSSLILTGGDEVLNSLKKELAEYNITVTLKENDNGTSVTFRYVTTNIEKEKSQFIARELLEFKNAFATEGLDNANKRTRDQDNFIRSIFSLIRETIKKLDKEKGQIVYNRKKLDEESGIEGSKKLILRSEDQIPVNDTKELQPIRSFFTYDPQKKYIEYEYIFGKEIENAIYRLLDGDLIILLENYGIGIRIEKTWSTIKGRRYHLGYAIYIKYNLERTKEATMGQAHTLKDHNPQG